MATPRSELINLDATPFYHCMARCVRRNYLCGLDEDSNKDYSHRKVWILNRLKYLTDVFAIDICAYGIMSNHYHLILHVDENRALNWSKAEVKARWAAIFPKNAKENEDNPKKLRVWREQLSSISWFMRCLNEYIAREANKEEDCHGRFWEGRFKSQALLDEQALLSAMVYVDLNPIRAGIALTPEESQFTSIYERLRLFEANNNKDNIASFLRPMFKQQGKSDKAPFTIDITPTEYFDLVDWSGRLIREDKRGAIPKDMAGIMQRMKIKQSGWKQMMQSFNQCFGVAAGAEVHIIDFAKKRQRKAFGKTAANRYFASA